MSVTPARAQPPALAWAAALLLLAGVLLAAPAQALYKWVDEQGRVHYSDEPPPGKVSKPLSGYPAAPVTQGPKQGASTTPSTTPGATGADWKAQETAFRQRRAEAANKAAAEAAQREEQARRCHAARDRLTSLAASSGSYTLNDRGERVHRSTAEHEQRIAQLQTDINQHCP